MDDGEIEKLKTVLRLDNQETAGRVELIRVEVTEENLKRLEEIYKTEEPEEGEGLPAGDFGEQPQ